MYFSNFATEAPDLSDVQTEHTEQIVYIGIAGAKSGDHVGINAAQHLSAAGLIGYIVGGLNGGKILVIIAGIHGYFLLYVVLECDSPMIIAPVSLFFKAVPLCSPKDLGLIAKEGNQIFFVAIERAYHFFI